MQETIQTTDFVTRTEMRKQANVSVYGYYPIGIDVGYSGTKVIAPNKIFVFPSFAIRVKGKILGVMGEESRNDIYYRSSDRPDEIWAVGRAAQVREHDDDTTSASERLYNRKRYFSDVFQICVSTALGIAVTPNEFGSANLKHVIVQTGLPAQFLLSDRKDITEAFGGTRKFDLKVGEKDWKHYEITLSADQISVIAQPLGTMISVVMDNAGNQVPERLGVYTENSLIVDPGFLTMDTVSLQHGSVTGMETFNDLGMHEVLRRTCDEIQKRYNVEARVATMQPHLMSGTVLSYDRKSHTGKYIDFSDILQKKCDEVAQDAVSRLDDTYDFLMGIKYLVITGGTGDAWYESFKKVYGTIPDIQLLRGNENSNLPMIYGNVRGYYLGLVSSLRQKGE